MNATMETDLAKQFYLAYVAYQQGVTFKTAEKNYGAECTPESMGELWLTLARLTIHSMQRTPGFQPLPVGSGVLQ